MTISTRKIGRIVIPIDLIEEAMKKPEYSSLAALFAKFIPFKIDWDNQFIDRTVTYYGFCESFREIPEGSVIPFYTPIFNIIDGEAYLLEFTEV